MHSSTDLPLAIPRIALLIADSRTSSELEAVLRQHYSSLLLITEREKLAELQAPVVVIVDSLRELQAVRELPPVPGTRIVVIAKDDPEILAHAFSLGAEAHLTYPFNAAEVLEVTEGCLEEFREEAKGAA